MLPWQNKTVQFVGEGAFSLADLQRSLSVLSIADTLPTPTLHTIGLPNMPARPPPQPPACHRHPVTVQGPCYTSISSTASSAHSSLFFQACRPVLHSLPSRQSSTCRAARSFDRSVCSACVTRLCAAPVRLQRRSPRAARAEGKTAGARAQFYSPTGQLDLQSVFTGSKAGDPMALLGSSGLVPRVSSCAATPNPCPAANSTGSA